MHVNVDYTDISLYMPSRDNLLNMDGIMFPDEEGTNIFIPSTFILNQMKNQGTYVSIYIL